MQNKAVAFLDLLGFSNAVQNDREGAIGMLADQSSALDDAVIDAKMHPVETYDSPEQRRLAESGMVTSFDAFLPMSDSIFITSAQPKLFVRQLSHLLVDLFRFRLKAFAYPESAGNPGRVTMSSPEIVNGRFQMTKRQATWWPVLYRGGVAIGEVGMLEMPAISQGSARVPNIMGPAVIDAVRLEQSLEKKGPKGPRVACSLEFAEAITGKAARYISAEGLGENDETREILWPMAMFEHSTGPRDAITDELNEWLKGTVNLERHFSSTNVGKHYRELINLTRTSFLAQWPDDCEVWEAAERSAYSGDPIGI